jgi:hypothetical protein
LDVEFRILVDNPNPKFSQNSNDDDAFLMGMLEFDFAGGDCRLLPIISQCTFHLF